jgi:O-antigen ligase
VAAGLFQALYVIFEMHFQYDPLWDMALWQFPWRPWTPADGPVVLPITAHFIRPLGTLARVDASMAWIAVTAPLWPVWLLPVAAYALWQGFSIGACAAFAIGVLLRFVLDRAWWQGASLGAGAVFFFGVVAYIKGFATPVIQGRIEIWQYALAHWSDPALIWPDRVLGWGLGNWSRVVPALQQRDNFRPSGEMFLQAHNEYIQWAMETGLIGVILLAGWLWSNRSIFAHRLWGGSLAALGINSLTFFPFHVPALGLLGVSLIGLALSTEVAHGG